MHMVQEQADRVVAPVNTLCVSEEGLQFSSDLSHLLSNTLTAVQLSVEEDTRLSLLLSPSLSV